MNTTTLLRWSFGAFTLLVAYVWSLPWLSDHPYDFTEIPTDSSKQSILKYIDNPHAKGVFVMSLVPLISLQWVDLARIADRPRDIRVLRVCIASLVVSLIGLTGMMGWDRFRRDGGSGSAVVTMASIMVYYLCTMRAAPVQTEWPLYAVLGTATLFLTLVSYTYYMNEIDETQLYYMQACALTALALFTPLRLYLTK